MSSDPQQQRIKKTNHKNEENKKQKKVARVGFEPTNPRDQKTPVMRKVMNLESGAFDRTSLPGQGAQMRPYSWFWSLFVIGSEF